MYAKRLPHCPDRAGQIKSVQTIEAYEPGEAAYIFKHEKTKRVKKMMDVYMRTRVDSNVQGSRRLKSSMGTKGEDG